jgi:hypothetical protein
MQLGSEKYTLATAFYSTSQTAYGKPPSARLLRRVQCRLAITTLPLFYKYPVVRSMPPRNMEHQALSRRRCFLSIVNQLLSVVSLLGGQFCDSASRALKRKEQARIPLSRSLVEWTGGRQRTFNSRCEGGRTSRAVKDCSNCCKYRSRYTRSMSTIGKEDMLLGILLMSRGYGFAVVYVIRTNSRRKWFIKTSTKDIGIHRCSRPRP